MRLRVRPAAEAEIAAAARWYEAKREGLGTELVALLESAFERISDRPAAFPTWRDDRRYQRLVIDRFPYVVFFQVISDDEVAIVAVAHQKRRPGYWRKPGGA